MSIALHLGAKKAENNGGSTDYYKLKETWTDLQDIIEEREMNFAQGNILKAAFTFNIGRHDGTNYERDLNKIIYFAQRELGRLQKGGDDGITKTLQGKTGVFSLSESFTKGARTDEGRTIGKHSTFFSNNGEEVQIKQ